MWIMSRPDAFKCPVSFRQALLWSLHLNCTDDDIDRFQDVLLMEIEKYNLIYSERNRKMHRMWCMWQLSGMFMIEAEIDTFEPQYANRHFLGHPVHNHMAFPRYLNEGTMIYWGRNHVSDYFRNDSDHLSRLKS